MKVNVKRKLIFFGILALLLLLFSIFSAYLTPYDPYEQDLSIAKEAPSAEHLLGTDRYGRDMLSRVIIGSQASIYSTLLLVVIITVLGTIIGIICGLSGKAIDVVLMRISDIFLAFPGLVFALAIAGVLGGGLHNAIIALAAVSWPKFARLARSQTLALKETAFIEAARLSGTGTLKMVFKHILPNIVGPILNLFPNAGDFIDGDELMKSAMEGQGMPQNIIREDDDVKKIREDRAKTQAEQQAQQQRLAMTQSLMQNANKMNEAPQEGSLLQGINEQLKGGTNGL